MVWVNEGKSMGKKYGNLRYFRLKLNFYEFFFMWLLKKNSKWKVWFELGWF